MFIPFFFFFNDTATTEIYTLSLHDALPIKARHLHIADLGEDVELEHLLVLRVCLRRDRAGNISEPSRRILPQGDRRAVPDPCLAREDPRTLDAREFGGDAAGY